MKIARFSYQGQVEFGAVAEDQITILQGSVSDGFAKTDKRVSLADIKWLPPSEPSKVVCIALNYTEHIKELEAQTPEVPIYFLKPPTSLVEHLGDIVYPPDCERVDYEGELGIVIAKEMKNIPPEEALEYVWGYTCFNDVTERAMVARSPLLLTISKGFDTFGAVGPWVVTDLNPNDLRLKTYLNGELMQDDNTGNCVFSVEQILHQLSRWMTLCPGDIVATGTPKGIAPMKPGDVVEVEISEIGRLRNQVVEGA
ncbi:MAG: fumarylacetoacetate hydrolase family protein [Desulfarculaceae bacterium]|jgi:2-keto-4-pentenoate hydratase/2-oxohepta-3-ene-1,7-dioic acid hydratase in catechol pathway